MDLDHEVDFELYDHRLTNYIDTKTNCLHLKNLPVKGLCGRCYRICKQEIQSVMLVFSTRLCELLPF
jgi:hypothetical protein